LFDYCSLLLAYEPDGPLQFALPLFVGAKRGNRSVNLPEHLFIDPGVPEDRAQARAGHKGNRVAGAYGQAADT
jgi:hypothetical protein